MYESKLNEFSVAEKSKQLLQTSFEIDRFFYVHYIWKVEKKENIDKRSKNMLKLKVFFSVQCKIMNGIGATLNIEQKKTRIHDKERKKQKNYSISSD